MGDRIFGKTGAIAFGEKGSDEGGGVSGEINVSHSQVNFIPRVNTETRLIFSVSIWCVTSGFLID